MEPRQKNCFDDFDKSYTPNCGDKGLVSVKSSAAMSKKYRKFHSSLQEYGNNASFHGLHFVTDPLSNKPRRLFWLLLLLVCLAVLVYQIIDRVIYFYSYPVTVNVKVNYNRTLEFPAVTICNQNAYK
ncbi:acid-sensing ion channel 5-like [Saccostrea echinata]|uniref:acid-sensing ion channel 5-like n=1 Tax=Saccostrea echinata TaxID=191078 RepID=UPI002A8125C3|nr:acid-sensing ion channel 5-like [Saccostrea echinata]